MPIELSSLDRCAIRFEDSATIVGLSQRLAGDVNGCVARSPRVTEAADPVPRIQRATYSTNTIRCPVLAAAQAALIQAVFSSQRARAALVAPVAQCVEISTRKEEQVIQVLGSRHDVIASTRNGQFVGMVDVHHVERDIVRQLVERTPA
jgi:hypothetical protein